ncbi:MAG: DUF349 domain-containing protein [Rikenellaceae bacterium]|nr:DUF349 domain-containing protein [Rikenellaceae bacterium]
METKDLQNASVPQEQVDVAAVPVEATTEATPETVETAPVPEPEAAETVAVEQTENAISEETVVEEPVVPENEVPQTVVEPAAPEADTAVEATVEIAEPAEEPAEESASEAENEAEAEAPAITDFNGLSKSEIVDRFAEILAEKPVQSIRREAEAAKVAFYKAWKAEVERLKKEFVAAGNPEEEFTPPTDADEQRLKELFAEYRTKRDAFLALSEEQKETNYKAKLQIIEELKELINSSETLNQTFNAFRALQNRWKEIGAVPQGFIKDLWDTYHLHVENFYNFVKINKELRDLDLRKNYEAKIALAEEAEALLLDPSPVSSFHKLQKLHEQWREVGPVANEYKEQLWDRFKEASSKINKRHQEYFEEIKEEQRRNLDLKTRLCEQTEELLTAEYKSRAAWENGSEKLTEIQKLWKTIGFAPKKENTKIYERFRAACDRFFEAKREFYTGLKGEMDINLKAKVALCEAAEALQESDEWKKTTDKLIALQKEWKTIGAVSRKHSEALWKRFRKACDTFFEQKSKHFSDVDSQYADNLAKKRELLAEIKAFEIGDREESFEALKDFQRRWTEIGFVAIKEKDKLQAEYREAIDSLFAALKGTSRDRKVERFREKLGSMKDNRSVRSERERLYNKVKQLEADIQLLENNIGFFAKSKNAEGMIRGVNAKIEKTKEEMATLIEKIDLIDKQNEE